MTGYGKNRNGTGGQILTAIGGLLAGLGVAVLLSPAGLAPAPAEASGKNMSRPPPRAMTPTNRTPTPRITRPPNIRDNAMAGRARPGGGDGGAGQGTRTGDELEAVVGTLIANDLGNDLLDAYLDAAAKDAKGARAANARGADYVHKTTEQLLDEAIDEVLGDNQAVKDAVFSGLETEDHAKNRDNPTFGQDGHVSRPGDLKPPGSSAKDAWVPGEPRAAAKAPKTAKTPAPAAPANTAAASPSPAAAPAGQASGGAGPAPAPAQTTVTTPDGRQIAVQPMAEAMASPAVRRADGIERAAELWGSSGAKLVKVSKHTAVMEYPNGERKVIYKEPGTSWRVESFDSKAGGYSVTTLFDGKKRVGMQVLTKTKSGKTEVAIYGRDIRADFGRIGFGAMKGNR